MFPSLPFPTDVAVAGSWRFARLDYRDTQLNCNDGSIAPVSKGYKVIMISALSSETICLFAWKASTLLLLITHCATSACVENGVNRLDNGACNSTRYYYVHLNWPFFSPDKPQHLTPCEPSLDWVQICRSDLLHLGSTILTSLITPLVLSVILTGSNQQHIVVVYSAFHPP